MALFALSVILPSTSLYAQSVDIPNMPVDNVRQVVITYRATVNSDTPVGTTAVSSAATVSGGNFPTLPPELATTAVSILGFALQSPVHFLWNGFLSMQNVVALINRDNTALGVVAKMLNQDGHQLSTTSLLIPANGEVDLAVNLLPGFHEMALGVLRLEFDRNVFDGNGFFYRFAKDNKTLEYMAGTAFDSALTGTSYVSYNTFQPSRRPGQFDNEVTNWLSISNMDSGATKQFTVRLYAQDGGIVKTSVLSVPPLGRRDIAAGHDDPGPSHAGTVQIVPTDDTAPYTASLARYGASAAVSAFAKFYHFAVLLPARNQTEGTEWAPISRGADGENWAVLTNTSNTTGTFRLRFLSSNGSELSSLDVAVPAHGQLHAFANAILPSGGSGLVEVTPLDARQYVCESTFYFYDQSNGELTAAYASPSRRPLGGALIGSYNTFLNQFDFVKVFNVGNVVSSETFTLNNGAGTALGSSSMQLDTMQGSEFAVHELPYAPGKNVFGSFGISAGHSGITLAEILRIQFSANGKRVEAAQSLPVRGSSTAP